jgi:Tfp pilus assembly protein PilW
MSLGDSMALWWGKSLVELIVAAAVLAVIVIAAFVKVFIIEPRRSKRRR